MENNIHVISKSDATSLREMLASSSEKNHTLAIGIIEARDKNDKESEANFLEIFKDTKILRIKEPTEVWVIKFNGKIVFGNKGKIGFKTKRGASTSFTSSLTHLNYAESKFDPNFRKWVATTGITDYIKSTFGDHTKFKHWLVDQKIVEFVKVDLNIK